MRLVSSISNIDSSYKKNDFFIIGHRSPNNIKYKSVINIQLQNKKILIYTTDERFFQLITHLNFLFSSKFNSHLDGKMDETIDYALRYEKVKEWFLKGLELYRNKKFTKADFMKILAIWNLRPY